jgi:hypothetical protein
MAPAKDQERARLRLWAVSSSSVMRPMLGSLLLITQLYEIHSPGSIRTKIVRKMSLMHVNGAWTKAGPCYPVARALWHNDSSSISYVARLLLCTEKFSKSFIKSLRHTIVVPLFTSV